MTDKNLPSLAQEGNTPVAYKGIPVMTTERLADEFGTMEVRIRQNAANNPRRFIEGVHFFKVSGPELKAMKTEYFPSTLLGTNAKSVILWTERGAMHHAKILETPKAWEVYGLLVDTYFAVRDETPLPSQKMAPNADELARRTDGIARMLAHKVTVLESSLTTLVHQVQAMVIASDPRVAAVTHVSQRQLLDAAKVPSKGRNSLNRRFAYHLPRFAIAAKVLPMACPHSGVLLYPVDTAHAFMASHGNAFVLAHMAKITGQGVLNFTAEKAKRKPLTSETGETLQ